MLGSNLSKLALPLKSKLKSQLFSQRLITQSSLYSLSQGSRSLLCPPKAFMMAARFTLGAPQTQKPHTPPKRPYGFSFHSLPKKSYATSGTDWAQGSWKLGKHPASTEQGEMPANKIRLHFWKACPSPRSALCHLVRGANQHWGLPAPNTMGDTTGREKQSPNASRGIGEFGLGRFPKRKHPLYAVDKVLKDDSTEGYEAKNPQWVGLRARIRTHEILVTLSWDSFSAPGEEEVVFMNWREIS